MYFGRKTTCFKIKTMYFERKSCFKIKTMYFERKNNVF